MYRHIMEVYGQVVDTELVISAQVSGPIGLQVGMVQLDLVSWPEPEMWRRVIASSLRFYQTWLENPTEWRF